MGRERPPDFADRLPRVVPKEETDISHLSDEMADLLYPGRRPRPFRIGVTFGAFEGPGYERAVAARAALARLPRGERARTERSTTRPSTRERRARCGTSSSSSGGGPGTEVLVDGKKVPYAHELWLPLFWIFVGGEA